jgi:hypothetical protein
LPDFVSLCSLNLFSIGQLTPIFHNAHSWLLVRINICCFLKRAWLPRRIEDVAPMCLRCAAKHLWPRHPATQLPGAPPQFCDVPSLHRWAVQTPNPRLSLS